MIKQKDKKIAAVCFGLLMILLNLSGCGNHGDPTELPAPALPAAQESAAVPVRIEAQGSEETQKGLTESRDPLQGLQEKEWSDQNLITMFSDVQEDDWVYLDCVLMPDRPYDRVGAVLFQDTGKGTCHTAFFDADGDFQQSGTDSRIADDPEFTYLGDGTVSFQLMSEDNTVYTYTLAFSVQGNQVSFQAKDDKKERGNGEESEEESVQ